MSEPFETEILTQQIERNADVFYMDNETKREPAEIIAEILSRYSVLDLREQTDADLEGGEMKLNKSDAEIKILEQGVTDFIHWWKVESHGKNYEVRRYENFAFCSCLDFFFGHKVCKHVYATTKDFEMRRRREMDRSPYLKPTSRKSTERLGGVRF
jgi:hypothetical protein